MEPEIIADYHCEVGEGPLWHSDDSHLYWVDIPNGRLFRYDGQRDQHEQVFETDVIGGYTIQNDNKLLLFGDAGRIDIWSPDLGIEKTVVHELPEERESRFNDVIADPEGRVFCGTMPTSKRLGCLYRLDVDGTITRVLDDIDISNGLAFTPDADRLYYTESGTRTIYSYAYDREDGSLSDEAVFCRVNEEDGFPDGMTIDEEGYVWSARWDGGCLVRYAPDGTIDQRITFPVRKVSSATFGGQRLDELYVTTAGGDAKETEGEHAGALFRLDTEVAGIEEFRSRVHLD